MVYLTGEFNLGLLAAMQGLSSVPVVAPEFLFDKVLPPLPPTLDLDKLQLTLRSENVIQKYGLRGFKISPKDSTGHRGHESRVFRPLVNLFNDIVKFASEDNILSPVLRMQHTSNPMPLSERTGNSQPDGVLELLERESVNTDVGKSNWGDIPVAIELTKFDSDADMCDVGLMLVYLDRLYSYLMRLSRIEPRSSGAYTI
jgi:hypothetical protein